MPAVNLAPICAAVALALCFTSAVADDTLASEAGKKYTAKIEEIDRVAAIRKAEAKKDLDKAMQEAEQLKAESQPRYRGMLGSYFNRRERIPFILLSVPNGQNVFGNYAESVLNGKYDFSLPLNSFSARGHVVIPKTAAYVLEASRGYGDFKLNGKGYSLSENAANNRCAAKVELTQGVYEVEFSTINNGGQLPGASVRILDEAGVELPIFVYESELAKFLGDLSLGVELVETSKWTREENKLD